MPCNCDPPTPVQSFRGGIWHADGPATHPHPRTGRHINKEKRPHSRRFRTLPHSAPATPRFVTSVCTAKEYKMEELKHYFEARGLNVVDSEEVRPG